MATEAPTAPPPIATPAPAPSAAPAPAPKPTTPLQRSRERMSATAVQADLDAPDPMKTVVPKSEVGSEKGEKPGEKPLEKPPEGKPAEPPEGKPAPTDGKKDSPWKLLDQFKTRVVTLERELAETKAKVPDPSQHETTSKRLEAAEKRRTELEEEIRYVNYAKSQEFAEKYQRPYEEAWAKAANDLAELQVTDENGAARPANAKDLVMLA